MLPVVAAVLVLVAIRMVELEELVDMFKYDKKIFLLMLGTAVIVVVDEPTSGLIIGTFASLIMFAAANAVSHGDLSVRKGGRITKSASFDKLNTLAPLDNLAELDTAYGSSAVAVSEEYGGILVYRIPGHLTYLNSPGHLEKAKKVTEPYHTIILSLKYLYFIDIDGLSALGQMLHDWESSGKPVLISAVQPLVKKMLLKTKWFKLKEKKKLVFNNYKEALKYIEDNHL